MGRKRNQGKARKAAKAKAREEEAERRGDDFQTAHSPQESPAAVDMRCQLISVGLNKECGCSHGFNPVGQNEFISFRFITAFHLSFIEAIRCGGLSLSECLLDARSATLEEFADVWYDLAKLKNAISHLLSGRTKSILLGNCNIVRDTAAIARFFEQIVAAVDLKQTQALPNWPKIDDTLYSDMHTLVKFFRHRIPCSCLDEKYEEVKHIPKQGYCYNIQCSIPGGKLERSKTKYCSRCRCVTYCSRECQESDWSRHKPHCDNGAAIIAEFEDRKSCAEVRARKRVEKEEHRMEEQQQEREEAFMEWERKQKEEILGLKSMLHKAMLQSALEKMYTVNFQKWEEAGMSLEDFDEFKEDFKDAMLEHFGEEEEDLEEVLEEIFEEYDEDCKKILLEDRLEEDKKHAEILGVSHDVDKRTLQKTYRKLALQYHPDRWSAYNERGMSKEEAEEHFKSIRSSYDHLMANFDE
jgi:DnaJ-domain-containing protein 1